jgi:hypothetical protein
MAIRLGSVWKHFKGNEYIVLETVTVLIPDKAEGIKSVLYCGACDNRYWVRPVEDFLYEGLLSDGTIGKRFTCIKD